MQVEHMLQIGRRRLAQINTFPTCYTKDELRRGAVEAARDAGVEMRLIDTQHPADSGSCVSDVYCEQVSEALRGLRGKIDGVLTMDTVAAACVRSALELGIKIPEELAIIGSDGSSTAANCAISLSTMAQPVDQIGRAIFDTLHSRIQERSRTEFRRLMIPPTLIARTSTIGRGKR
jgi:LacI family transcriptional regulator